MMWIFAHVNSPSGLARIFILHAHIHATREVTLSAEDLTTMSGGRQQEHTSPMQSIFTHQSIFPTKYVSSGLHERTQVVGVTKSKLSLKKPVNAIKVFTLI